MLRKNIQSRNKTKDPGTIQRGDRSVYFGRFELDLTTNVIFNENSNRNLQKKISTTSYINQYNKEYISSRNEASLII